MIASASIAQDLPPADFDAERQTLGYCLLHPEKLHELDLCPADFHADRHRIVWQTMRLMLEEGVAVNTVSLRARLEEAGVLQRVGGLDGLLELTSGVPLEQVDVLKRKTRLRVLRAQGERLLRASRVGDFGEVGAAVTEASRVLDDALSSTRPRASHIEWRGTDDIFRPLPATKWLVPGLQLCPGRPAQIQGYGASAKTLSAQSLALAVVSGQPVWGRFETLRGEVRHLDYEQGWHATARRYQRLALGHSIDPMILTERLKLAVFPSVYLDSPDAVDAYAKACEGADLVILDALRGATPSHDENDSKIRACLDNLTRVSEKTATAFLVLHHAGKPREGTTDARTIGRGSSAIFDASGCILAITTKGDRRTVSQIKQPAEAEGGALEDFTLRVEDMPYEGNPTAGVRVVCGPVEVESPVQREAAKYERDAQKLLDAIRAKPGITYNTLVTSVGIGRTRARDLLYSIEDERRVVVLEGARGSKAYRIGPG